MKNHEQNLRKQAEFFNRLGNDYIETVQNEYKAIYQQTCKAVEPFVQGRVLDIGSGGIDLLNSNDMYVLYDIAPVLLNCHKRQPGRYQVCGDAVSLPFAADSFDTVLFHFSIHHFAQDSFSLTNKYMKDVVSEAKRVCKPSGNLIIAENTISFFLEYMESLFYPVMKKILDLFNNPPVFFFSEKRLHAFCRLNHLTAIRICSFKEPSTLLVSPVNIRFKINPVYIKVFVVNNG